MATKQPRPYCRILDYINATNPELAETIQSTCSEQLLRGGRKYGVTLIVPDKAFIARVNKLVDSDSIEDSVKACAMVNSLIMRDVYKTPTDWTTRGVVSNALFPSQIVEVASTSAKEVVFKSGAKITPDPDFKDSSSAGNLAVWKLTSGEMPITTDKPAMAEAKKSKTKTGGYIPTPDHSQALRFRIARAVENLYAIGRIQHDAGEPDKDAFCENVCSLLHFIMNVKSDHALMYGKILPLISFDKFDFYVLVEPHKHGKAYLIDDALITEWWSTKPACDVHAVRAQVEKMLVEGEGALVYTDRLALLAKISELRLPLTKRAESQPRSAVDAIEADYIALEKNNAIGGLGPVYPESLIAYYRSEPGLKMLHDELRYLSYGSFARLESEPFDPCVFHELVNTIGECLYNDDHGKGQKLLNKTAIKYQIAPTDKLEEIKLFVNSTMFMYIPLTKEECMSIKQKYSLSRPNPHEIVLFNISADLFNRHARLACRDHSSVATMIATLDVSKLDPALVEALRKKLN